MVQPIWQFVEAITVAEALCIFGLIVITGFASYEICKRLFPSLYGEWVSMEVIDILSHTDCDGDLLHRPRFKILTGSNVGRIFDHRIATSPCLYHLQERIDGYFYADKERVLSQKSRWSELIVLVALVIFLGLVMAMIITNHS